MENFLKPLESIKQVEAPPFLYTRIQQRIQKELSDHFSLQTAYSIAAIFVVLFALNILIMVNNRTSSVEVNNIAMSFHLMPDNNLYQ